MTPPQRADKNRQNCQRESSSHMSRRNIFSYEMNSPEEEGLHERRVYRKKQQPKTNRKGMESIDTENINRL